MRLDDYSAKEFGRGRPFIVEVLWVLVSGFFVAGPLPGGYVRVFLLRLFGANIGSGVVVKPGVKVKFPWRLRVGDHSWIGENVWIDNLAEVKIGDHVCISQGAYLCTGSHDWSRSKFNLITRTIVVSDHAWVGAFARVAPGSVISTGAVVAMGSVAIGEISPWTVYQGNPAKPIKKRIVANY